MLLKCFLERLERWESVFAQKRTHRRALHLTVGLICGLGRRTLTRALSFLGWQDKDWTASFRVFSRSPWASEALFTPVVEESIRDWLPAHGPIPVAFDDTGLPRTGKKIKSASWQRDPMSPPFHVNLRWGQRFLQASILLPLYRKDPAQSARAVPVRFAECPVVKRPGKKATAEERAAWRKAKKTHSLSAHFVALLKAQREKLDALGYKTRLLLGLGDGSYCNRITFRAEWDRVSLICRTRKDVRLCFGHQGRGRFYAKKTFTPEEIYDDPTIPWRQARIYHGGKRRVVHYKEVPEIYWRTGAGRTPLRLIVVGPTPYRKTKHGRTYQRRRAYLLTTDASLPVKQLLQPYFDRFHIEYNHRDEKDILGVGQAQVWADKSVARVPEVMVAAYALLLLAGLAAYGPGRTAAYVSLPKWRRRARRPSCQDLVNLLRQQIDAARRAGADGIPASDFAQMVARAAA
jgi:hypothetical protein